MNKFYLIVSTITMYVVFGVAVCENWHIIPYTMAIAIPYGFLYGNTLLKTGKVQVSQLTLFNIITYGSAALLFPETALMMIVCIVLGTANLQVLRKKYEHIAAFA